MPTPSTIKQKTEGSAMREADALAAAEADYAAALGTIITVEWLYGYRDNDSIDLHCDPPVAVRVLPTTAEDRAHRIDSWLDPYWNVEPLTDVGLRSCWVFGPSYHIDQTKGEQS